MKKQGVRSPPVTFMNSLNNDSWRVIIVIGKRTGLLQGNPPLIDKM